MTPATKAPPVHEGRIREGEHELVQAEVALAMAESHLQDLKSDRTK